MEEEVVEREGGRIDLVSPFSVLFLLHASTGAERSRICLTTRTTETNGGKGRREGRGKQERTREQRAEQECLSRGERGGFRATFPEDGREMRRGSD